MRLSARVFTVLLFCPFGTHGFAGVSGKIELTPQSQSLCEWARDTGLTLLVMGEDAMTEVCSIKPGESEDAEEWLKIVSVRTPCFWAIVGDVVVVMSHRPLPRPLTELWYEPWSHEADDSDVLWCTLRDATQPLGDLLLRLGPSCAADSFRDARVLPVRRMVRAWRNAWQTFFAEIGVPSGALGDVTQHPEGDTTIEDLPALQVSPLRWRRHMFYSKYAAQMLPRFPVPESHSYVYATDDARMLVGTPSCECLGKFISRLSDACSTQIFCDRRIASTPVFVLGDQRPMVSDVARSLAVGVAGGKLTEFKGFAHYGLDCAARDILQTAETLLQTPGYVTRWFVVFYDSDRIIESTRALALPDQTITSGMVVRLVGSRYGQECVLVPRE